MPTPFINESLLSQIPMVAQYRWLARKTSSMLILNGGRLPVVMIHNLATTVMQLLLLTMSRCNHQAASWRGISKTRIRKAPETCLKCYSISATKALVDSGFSTVAKRRAERKRLPSKSGRRLNVEPLSAPL